MFGTVAHMRPKPGQEEALRTLVEEWDAQRRPKVKGARAGYTFRCEQHPGEYILVAVFDDRESYMANARDPEQDRWYQRLRAVLEADPTWEDGEVIYSMA